MFKLFKLNILCIFLNEDDIIHTTTIIYNFINIYIYIKYFELNLF